MCISIKQCAYRSESAPSALNKFYTLLVSGWVLIRQNYESEHSCNAITVIIMV